MKKEYLIYKLSEDLKEATRIENELFRKFDVKRGLRKDVYKRQVESYYGDELTLFMDDAGEGVYDVEVKKNGS